MSDVDDEVVVERELLECDQPVESLERANEVRREIELPQEEESTYARSRAQSVVGGVQVDERAQSTEGVDAVQLVVCEREPSERLALERASSSSSTPSSATPAACAHSMDAVVVQPQTLQTRVRTQIAHFRYSVVGEVRHLQTQREKILFSMSSFQRMMN